MLLLAGSSFFIYYLHEMRTYSLSITLAALALWGYIWLMRESTRFWLPALALFVGAAGMVYTHYSNALVLLPLAVYHLLFARKGRRWWGVVGVVLVAALSFVPYLPIFWRTYTRFLTETVAYIPDWTAWEIARMIAEAFSNEVVLLLVPMIVGAIWAAARPQRESQRQTAILALVAGVGGVLLLVMLQETVQLVAHIRYMATLWVPLALLGGVGLGRLPSRWLTAPFIAAWLIVGVWGALQPERQSRYTDDLGNSLFRTTLRWDLAGAVLHDETTPFDAVAVSLSDYNPWSIRRAVDIYVDGLDGRYTYVEFLDNAARETPRFTVGASQVWTLRPTDQPASDAFTAAETHISEAYVRCDRPLDTGGMQLERYAVSDACCSLPSEADATFGGVTALQHSQVDANDDRLTAWLGWNTNDADAVSSYSVGLYLLDDVREVIAQSDTPLAATSGVCVPHDLSFEGVPTGTYNLAMSVYNWETVTPLQLSDSGMTVYELGEVNVDG